ncbi:MAG: hypothetical protein ACMG6S_30190, partial [Byssovorax sp.]
MSTTPWTTFFAGAVALVASTLLAASCGGSGDSGTLGTGSGAGTPGDECVRAGAKCALGCEANLGCVECKGDTDCRPGAPVCVLGKCEACGDNTDCGTGKACFPREHTCQTKCAGNQDCGGDQPLCDPI